MTDMILVYITCESVEQAKKDQPASVRKKIVHLR